MKNRSPLTGSPVPFLAACALAAFVQSPRAEAILTLDLRAVSVTAGYGTVIDAKTVHLDPSAADADLIMELWAVVTGNDTIINETLSSLRGCLVSSPGSVVNRDADVAGNLAHPASPNTIHENLVNTLMAPWKTSTLASDGAIADLDGDGDLDVGSLVDGASMNYIQANAGFYITGAGMDPANFHELPNGRAFKISNVTFHVTDLEPDGATAVNYYAPSYTGLFLQAQRALFMTDGAIRNGTDANLAVAAPVLVTVVPEPAALGLAFAGCGLLAARRRR